MMRILHIADLHFGIDLHRVSLIEDQRYVIAQIKNLVIEQRVDIVLLCGDIYDTMLASKEAIELYDELVTMLCQELQLQVVVISGNHDSAVRISSCASLLASSGLHVFGKITQRIQGIVLGDVVIVPIPFFHVDHISRIYEEKLQNEEEAFRCILEDVRRSLPADKKIIVMAHAFISGATQSESDRFANVGGSDLTSASVFEGFDYVALGHLHRMQKINERVWYSGSPIAYSFSESKYQKAVLLYDSTLDKVEVHPLRAFHQLVTFTGTFEECKHWRAANEDDYVRLEVTDMTITFDMMNFFQERIQHLLQLSGETKQAEQTISLEMNDMDTLNDIQIMSRFYMDTFQKEIGDDEMKLFVNALQELEDETNAT